jgi:hypothetical protein
MVLAMAKAGANITSVTYDSHLRYFYSTEAVFLVMCDTSMNEL